MTPFLDYNGDSFYSPEQGDYPVHFCRKLFGNRRGRTSFPYDQNYY